MAAPNVFLLAWNAYSVIIDNKELHIIRKVDGISVWRSEIKTQIHRSMIRLTGVRHLGEVKTGMRKGHSVVLSRAVRSTMRGTNTTGLCPQRPVPCPVQVLVARFQPRPTSHLEWE